MKPSIFNYKAPATLEDAISLLAGDADAVVLAGGQTLLSAMNFRAANPSLLVDIQHVAGLRGIVVGTESIVVKAMVRHREFELDEDVQRLNPLIAEVMQHVAHIPIRNRGTVVGSLCHADPSAEMPLLLVLLGGSVIAQGPAGRREIAAEDFFQSFLTTARNQDEIVVEARFSLLPPKASDLDAAVAASVAAVTQPDDITVSASYRRRALGTLIRRMVAKAAQRAQMAEAVS